PHACAAGQFWAHSGVTVSPSLVSMSADTREPIRMADLIPLERVPYLLPHRPDRSTVFRWVSQGCCGRRLRTVSVGRTRHTTERWLLSFFQEIAGARAGDPALPA